jgi:hypothetical protein
MSGYLKYGFDVVEADSLGRIANLELWVSTEESEYVEFAVTSSKGFESMGFEPGVAAQLADALDQRAPVEVPAVDDYDDSHAELHVSWDADGADLLLMLQGRSVRVVIDYDEQPGQIAQALRECAAELGLAATG